jgi:hypothetical protein
MILTPGILAALVVLLSPGLYDPLADPPPSVSPLAIRLTEPHMILAVVVIMGIVIALLVLPHVGQVRRYRARIRDMEALLDDGIPVCLDCGGRLDGVQGPACPRCSALWSRWYPSEHGRPVLPRPATSGPR